VGVLKALDSDFFAQNYIGLKQKVSSRSDQPFGGILMLISFTFSLIVSYWLAEVIAYLVEAVCLSVNQGGTFHNRCT